MFPNVKGSKKYNVSQLLIVVDSSSRCGLSIQNFTLNFLLKILHFHCLWGVSDPNIELKREREIERERER